RSATITRFTNFPDALYLAGLADHFDYRRLSLLAKPVHQFVCLSVRAGSSVTAKFCQQITVSRRQQSNVFWLKILLAHDRQDIAFEPFQRDGFKSQDVRNGIGRDK